MKTVDVVKAVVDSEDVAADAGALLAEVIVRVGLGLEGLEFWLVCWSVNSF